MYLVLALALAVDWITPPDPRLPVHGLPWYAENSGEAIRLPQRLKASLPPAVWNLGLSPSGGRLRFRTDSTRGGRRQVQILNRHDDCCFGERHTMPPFPVSLTNPPTGSTKKPSSRPWVPTASFTWKSTTPLRTT